MRVGFHLTPGLIRRRYDLGVDSIIRLVDDLKDEIDRLSALHVAAPQKTIHAQVKRIKQLEQTITSKNAEIIELNHLNGQLQKRVRELEKALVSDVSNPPVTVNTVGRDSHNSSQPPSLDLPWKKPKRTRSLRQISGLRSGGQPGHRGTTLRAVTDPHRVIVHTVPQCLKCGLKFAPATYSRVLRRQVFEIENGGLAVTEHRAPIAVCPACQSSCRAQFPRAVSAPVQYGVSVLSRALYLHLYQLLPVARTQEAMRDLFGCRISQASIVRAARLCSSKLIRCEQRIKNAVRAAAVVGADETGIRINGTNAWVHVARTETLTHLATHSHRGRTAFDTIGILSRFQGTLVRDGWFSYKQFEQCRHSLCNAHLLRDLIYVGESEPHHRHWTDRLGKLLLEIKDTVEVAKTKGANRLEEHQQTDFLERYDQLLTDAGDAVRGSPARFGLSLTAHKLHHRFLRNKELVLRFMTDFAVPFDNNGAERDLRMLKLQQKIAGCFRTTAGVQTFCRVRSYLSSAKKQGKDLLASLNQALVGKPVF